MVVTISLPHDTHGPQGIISLQGSAQVEGDCCLRDGELDDRLAGQKRKLLTKKVIQRLRSCYICTYPGKIMILENGDHF